MDRVVVTVKQYAKDEWFDIELPLHMPIGDLAIQLASALDWSTGDPFPYELEIDPPGRLLLRSETLAQAGVWDGAWLVFHHKGGPLPAFPTQTRSGAREPAANNQRSPSPRSVTTSLPMPLPELEPIEIKEIGGNTAQSPVNHISPPLKQGTPLKGWRGLDLPDEQERGIEEEHRNGNYSWKQLDE